MQSSGPLARSLIRIVAGGFVLAACGRFGFDPAHTAGGDDIVDDAGDDVLDDAVVTTGPAGARWIRGFGPASSDLHVAGVGGEVVALANVQTSLAVEGATLSSGSPFGGAGLVRYDPAGTIISTAVLDATGYCDIRGLAMRGDDALAVGLTIGGIANPAFGPCSQVANRQDPIEVGIDRAGQQYFVAHWVSTNINAQGWGTAAFADGSIAMSGIYGSMLAIGAALPTAGADPNTFLTRFADGASTPQWAVGLSATVHIDGGPLAADGNELCALGTFDGPVTILGSPLPHAGSTDAWIARLDSTGAPKFVRAIGTSGTESGTGGATVAVAPGGGCYVSAYAGGDLVIDTLSLPASAGPAVVVQLDGGGTAVSGFRLPAFAEIVRTGGRLYGALDVTAPISIAGISYAPSGRDVIVVELDATGPVRLAGVIGGAGDQSLLSFYAIAGDAVAVATRSTGELVFGSAQSDSGVTAVRAVAALGL